MSDYLCPYICSYRTNAGYCGYTDGHVGCQYRRIIGFDYESKQFWAEPVKTPGERYVWHPKTNADKIRQMTDEELADFITRQRFSVVNTLADKLGIDVTMAFIVGRKNVLDWLKQEVESDETNGART